MPQRAKGARLFLRERKGREPVYVILDTGGIEQSTGSGDRATAEIALANYIARKNRSTSGPAEASDMSVADVLAIYGEEHAPTLSDPARIAYAMTPLLAFWGESNVSAIKGATCRRYAAERKLKDGTIRRELNVLAAACNYAVREGYLVSAPPVTMPKPPETSQRALTRDEIARLLWACRGRYGLRRHLAQFILVSIYTGTRKDAVLNIRLSGPALDTGWFDLEQGLLYRRGVGERATKKRRTPVRVPRQLLAHARRWHRLGNMWAVEDVRRGRVGNVAKGFAALVEDAKIGTGVTPHTLKHTAITWAIQRGASVEDAASFFATSIETIQRVYWHHSPHFQRGAVRAMENAR